MAPENQLVFKSGKPLPRLQNERYLLRRIKVVKGDNIDGFCLNIISYIGEVRSHVPIIFSTLPDIIYQDHDKREAVIFVKLDFTDKTNIELILTSTTHNTGWELIIDYDIL